MPKKNEKRSNDKNQKVLGAEESKSKWADSNSDHQVQKHSESEDDETHYLTKDIKPKSTNFELETKDDSVFDFSYDEFTREDLIHALHDMAKEYTSLSKSFKEIKTENNSQTGKSSNSSRLRSQELGSLEA